MEQQEPVVITTEPMPGIRAMFSQTWRRFKAHYRNFLPLIVILTAAAIMYAIISNGPSMGATAFAGLLNTFIVFISYIALIVVTVSEHTEVGSVNLYYQKAWKLFIPYIVVSFMVALSTVGGLILFVVPALVVSSFLVFAPYVLIAEETREMQALIRSWYYVRGNFWKILIRFITLCIFIFVLTLVYAEVCNLLGAHMFVKDDHVAAFLYTLFQIVLATPFVITYMYLLYVNVKMRKPMLPTEQEELKIKKGLKTLMIIGGVGLIVVAIISMFVHVPATFPF